MSQFIEMFKSTDYVQLNSLVTLSKSSIMPQDGSIYTLYSFPAYDNNQTPEIVDGREIKSSKIVLEENVVLFNKLNVRLSRVWNIHCLSTKNNICSSEFLPLKVKNSSVISQSFLYRILCSDYVTKKMMDCSTGTSNSQKRITPSSLMYMNVPLPSIDEQQKFVAIANQADKSGFDELKSQFIEMFKGDFPKLSWEECLTIINGKKYDDDYQESGTYPICGSGGIMGYGERMLCPKDTVILGRKGNINSPIYMETDYWIVDTAFCLDVDRTKLHPKYFYFWCKLFDFTRYNKQGVLPSLTKNDLLKIEMPIPPMELQTKFVDIIEQSDKSGSVLQYMIAC